MPCCVNLINVFFRYHNFWNKKFPEQVINFQFSREPPSLDAIMNVWFKHELVQVYFVKYFTDCICRFVYFLNGKFTMGKVLPGGNFSVRYFYIQQYTKLVDHTNVSKLVKLVPKHIWVWCVTCNRVKITHERGTKILVVSWRVDRSMYGCLS